MARQTNSIEQHIKTKQQQAVVVEAVYDKATKYLRKISTEFKGSPLNVLFDPNEVKLAEEFIDLMSKNNFVGSTKIKLEAKTNARLLIQSEIVHHILSSKVKLRLKDKFTWKKLWNGNGYPIGVLISKNTIFTNLFDSVPVYLCTDQKLRCRRSQPLFEVGQTYTSGFGTLPDKVLIDYKFVIGNFISGNIENELNFRKSTLREILISIAEKQLLK